MNLYESKPNSIQIKAYEIILNLSLNIQEALIKPRSTQLINLPNIVKLAQLAIWTHMSQNFMDIKSP